MTSIFISYSSLDNNKKDSVVRQVEKHKKILNPIVVASRRKAGEALTDKVIDGIEECHYFVPIITKKSIGTQWMNQEIGYAKAKGKIIWPIVEKGLELRGFVHNQMDLFQFVGDENNGTEGKRFSRLAKELINEVLLEIKPEDTLKLQELFPGVWESDFRIGGRRGGERNIKITEANGFSINGHTKFRIEQLKFSDGRIEFTKVHVSDLAYKIYNDLNVIELGKLYKGYENNTKLGERIPITYRRNSI